MSTAEQKRAYRAANPDKVRKQIAEWRKRNPHKSKEYSARRYAKHAPTMLANARAKRAENPDKARRATRESKYRRLGVDPVAAETARKAHDGSCDCCGTTEPGGKGQWNMDHDHKTGRVRGILCFNCNIGIGKLGDSLTGVLQAALYLHRSQEKHNA